MDNKIKYSGPKVNTISSMFNNIAPSYDLLNHVFSFGLDFYWRRKARQKLINSQPKIILDSACGTGDMAISLLKLKPKIVYGVDISYEMLQKAEEKVKNKNISTEMKFIKTESELLPFSENYFDAVTIAFGIRNFESPLLGLQEFCRVLKMEGNVVILELTKPKSAVLKHIYYIYSQKIMPFLGGLISGDNKAYKYLPKSVENFPEGYDFIGIMEEAGFTDNTIKKLTFGIVTIYMGKKFK